MNFIFNPSFITAKVLEIIVKFGAITSSSFFKSNALIAISNAAVPLDTATAFLWPIYLAKFFSNNLTLGPSEDIHPLFKILLTDKTSELVTNGSFTGMNFFKVFLI